MKMCLPVFFLYAIFAVVNVYFPLFLRGMGYSITQIGFLLSLFEIAGLVLPLFVMPIVSRSKKYGLSMLLFCLILVLIPCFLFNIVSFAWTAFFLTLYSIGFKAAIPVSDAMVSISLGDNHQMYGKIRVLGSIGFVVMSLLMQNCIQKETLSSLTMILWTSIPPLFVFFLIIPGLLRTSQKETLSYKKEKTQSSLKGFSPSFWEGLVFIFFIMLGQVPFSRFLSVYVSEYLHSNASGFLWALSAMAEIPFMFFSWRFIKRFGSMRLLLFCAVMTTVRNCLYVLFPSIIGASFAQVLNCFTFGLMHPAAVIFTTEHAPNEEHMVVGQSLYSIVAVGLAYIIGNALGGVLIDRFGYATLFISFGSLPLIASVAHFLYAQKNIRLKR